MSKQREQKAWAVVCETGDIVRDSGTITDGQFYIFRTKKNAQSQTIENERVVPCLITWREETQ